jgi:hypothetical protein
MRDSDFDPASLDPDPIRWRSMAWAALALIAIVASGLLGWEIGHAVGQFLAPGQVAAADHTGHRPPPPPLPTSPFRTP